MHGRVWIAPLFVLFWLIPSFIQQTADVLTVQAATDAGTLSRDTSPNPAQKKRRAATSRLRKKPRARSTSEGRSGLPGEETSKKPDVRRHAAQNAFLRRLAAAGLLQGQGFGESRILDTWRIRLVDGDTFWYGSERIRIRGYDAPERSQPGGFDATQRLEALLHEGEIRMYPHGLDVYGRTLADVYVDQRNVADVMIAEGYVKKR